MPLKSKITRDMILGAAMEVACEEGSGYTEVRS